MGLEISIPPAIEPNFGTAAFKDAGSAVGQVPVIPVSMSSMTTPVKATIDAITAMGGPTWIASLITAAVANAYADSAVTSEAASRNAAIAILTAGSPDQLNTFLETYNRFLTDESASSAINSALASEASTRAANDVTEASLRAGGDSTNASAIAAEATARGSAITSEASTRATAISTEQGARAAADTTLTNALATETTARTSGIAGLASQLTTDEATATALLAAVTAITPHKTSATVDFGYAAGNGEGDYATTTVNAAWVSSSSRIICRCSPSDSLDHTTDETIAEGITFDAVNIVPGTSFDVKAFAPAGTWGRHDCSILAL